MGPEAAMLTSRFPELTTNAQLSNMVYDEYSNSEIGWVLTQEGVSESGAPRAPATRVDGVGEDPPRTLLARPSTTDVMFHVLLRWLHLGPGLSRTRTRHG